MEENFELEEGEAHYWKGDEDHINLDTDLSYIDEKVQNVLGHHLKDFEGEVSAENLGPKYGGYGSFLPSYDHYPSFGSHPKTLERDSTTAKFLYNLSVEGATQNLKPTLNAPPPARLSTASCVEHSLRSAGVSSGGVSVNHDSHLSSAKVSEKFKMEDGSSNKSSNPTNRRTLRVRIKVSSSKMARNNEAIYSGLGLENSPSSSLGNSAEESGGTNSLSQETADESPTSILQVMTSFPVPEGVLISPLHDSLLCLIRKDRFFRDWESVPSLNGSREYSPLLEGESISNIGAMKLLKGTKAKLVGKTERPLELKHGSDMKYEAGMTSLLKKELETETPEGKDVNSNGLRHTRSPNLGCVIGSVKCSGRASEVSKEAEADKDRVTNGVFSSNLVVEDLLESSDQDCGKSQKQNAKGSSVEKLWEQGVISSRNVVSSHVGDNGSHRGNKAFTPLKSHSGGFKCNGGAIAPSKQKVGKQPSVHVLDEIDEDNGRTKPFFEGKKSKGNQIRGKVGSFFTKESFRDDTGMAPKDQLKWLSSDGPKDSGPNNFDVELKHNAYLAKSNENFSGKKVDNPTLSGQSIKDAPFVGSCTLEGRHGTEMVPGAVDPIVIQENWVCCDNCQKWRLLPFGTKPEQLPDNWLCSMLNWLPAMNRCDISEEETTKELYSLYQIPFSEGQNNMQNDSNGTASVITSACGQQLDRNHQNLNSAAVSIQGKKKYGLKEIAKASSIYGIKASKSTKNHPQDSVKSRSLSDMNRLSAESNIMKKSTSLHLNKSCNLDTGKHITKTKEKQMNGGGVKQLKIKNKRDFDQHEYVTSKKAKIEDKHAADKHRNSDVDLVRVGLKPTAGLQTKAGEKRMLRYEFSCSEDAKGDAKGRLLLSSKKLKEQVQVLSDGGSLNMRTHDERNNSMKKRKLQDDLKGCDSKKYAKEGSSESGFWREEKSRLQNAEGRISSSNKVADNKSNNRVTPFLPSKGHPDDVVESFRSLTKDRQLWKHRRKVACQQTLDVLDSMRRVFEPGEVSVAATSSSSKVSGSRKNRANTGEVKGSPVESVSSSPFRTSCPDKLTSAAEDTLGKDDGGSNCLPVTGNQEKCWDGEGDGEINQSGILKKEKDFCNSYSETLKFSTLGYRDGYVNYKVSDISEVPSEFGNGHLNDVDVDSVKHQQQPGDMHDVEHGCDGDTRNQNNHEKVFSSQMNNEDSLLQSKDGSRSSAYGFLRDKMKVPDPLTEHGNLFLKKSIGYESSQNDLDLDAPFHDMISEDKHNVPKRYKFKFLENEKNHISGRDLERQLSSDGRMEKQVVVKELHDSNVKLSASTNRKAASQQNLMQDFEAVEKYNQSRREIRNGMMKLVSQCETADEQKTGGHQSIPGLKRRGMFDEVPLADSCKGDLSRASINPENVGKMYGARHSSLHCTPDLYVFTDFNASSPRSMKSSSQHASNALKEAKELIAYADRLKSSGFDFESNEASFQAALKFLHGSLYLETWSGEGGRNGNMTQIQVYNTAAKLCESCAHEYERRQEMAVAALAYKCMEVSYMRVVYCKHSIISRDRNELQAALQIASQGDSPSSSASDVDNLNNQVTADKATSSKGAISHVTGNHVIVGRNRPNFIRLLDFTQDVNFAMKASRKCLNTFAAANITLEEAQKRDYFTAIKRVIDFSFQDVEELLRLVRLAMEAINRSGLGGARY